MAGRVFFLERLFIFRCWEQLARIVTVAAVRYYKLQWRAERPYAHLESVFGLFLMGDSSGVDCVSKFDWAILSQIECAMGSSAVLIRVTSTPCWCVEARMAGPTLCPGPVCIRSTQSQMWFIKTVFCSLKGCLLFDLSEQSWEKFSYSLVPTNLSFFFPSGLLDNLGSSLIPDTLETAAQMKGLIAIFIQSVCLPLNIIWREQCLPAP